MKDIQENFGGHAISRAQIVASLVIGAIGIAIAGLQPMLFGSLERVGRITIDEIGLAATAELIGIALGAVLADQLSGKVPVKMMAVLSAILLVIANYATMYGDGSSLIWIRGFAGIPGGVMIWIATAAVVRSSEPGLYAALAFILQAVLQFALAALIGGLAPGSVDATPVALAIVSMLALPLAALLPSRFSLLPKEPTHSGLPTFKGWLAVLAIFAFQFSIVGAWVFVELLATEIGLSVEKIAITVPLLLGAQVVGGLVAISVERRLAWPIAIFIAAAGIALTQIALAAHPVESTFFILIAAYGFLWNFGLPFLTPLAIAADPTRRVAQYAPPVMLIGAASGPAAVASLASTSGPSAVMLVCASIASVAVALALAIGMIGRKK